MAWQDGTVLAVEDAQFAPEPNLSGSPHYLDKLPEPKWLKDIDQGSGGYRARWTQDMAEVERLYAVPWTELKSAIDYLLGWTTALPSPGNPKVARLQRILPHQDALCPWLWCDEVRIERGLGGLVDHEFTDAQNYDGSFIDRSTQSGAATQYNPTGSLVAGAPGLPADPAPDPDPGTAPPIPPGSGSPPALPAAAAGAAPVFLRLTVDPYPGTIIGQLVSLSVVFTAPPLPGYPLPTGPDLAVGPPGRVVFFDGSQIIGTAAASEPSISVAFAAGEHQIVAQFLPSNPIFAPAQSQAAAIIPTEPEPETPAPRLIRLSYPQYIDDTGDLHLDGRALIRAIYRPRNYELRPDWERDLPPFNGTETCRWLSIEKRFAISGVPIGKVSGSLLRFVDDNTIVPEGGLLLLPAAHVMVTWHELPDFPEDAYDACLGKVNATDIQLPVPAGKIYKAETLLCQPCDLKIKRNIVGRRTVTATYRFDEKPQGWNSYPRAGGGFGRALLNGAGGTPVFTPVEFSQLFIAPAPLQWH